MRFKYLQTLKLAAAMVACTGLLAAAMAQIPELRVTTQNNAAIPAGTSSSCGGGGGGWGMVGGGTEFKYVKISEFKITGASNSAYNITRSAKPDSIRRRGNSTSSLDKFPMRIKFEDKVSLFGKEGARSWVLLANHYDGTFALNAMAFELGKRLGLDFTPTYQFVNVWVNGSYRGIYQLTEQIQSNPGRVDIREKWGGWLVEFDYHEPAADECFSYFTTGSNRYNLTTFIKSPELDEIVTGRNPNAQDSAQHLRFVKTDIMALVNKMSESGFPTNGYRDLIDLESFAKYMLIQLVLDNFDFNSKTQTGGLPGSNFAYRMDEFSKIQAGPLWDFDLAAGVQNNMMGGFPGMGGGAAAGFPAHYQTYQDSITPRHAFYQRLWADPVFKAKYKKIWDYHYQKDFTAMSGVIDSISKLLTGSITAHGTNSWANNQMSGSSALTASAFTTEVNNLKTWWTNRLQFVNQKMSSYNINTSADPDPYPNTSVTPPVTGTNYTLTVNAGTGGTVNPSGASQRASGASISVTATANSGYTFTGWTGAPSGANASANPITFSMPSSNVTLTANFSNGTNPPATVGDTLKVEAEDYTSKNGNNMQTSTANGITNIGYIENGYSTTYNNINVSSAGARTMVFRIASQNATSFSVSVNGTNVGTISSNGTGDWDTYTDVTLGSNVQLNSGNNTIVLNFQNAVNVDYFLLIGEKTTSINYGIARAPVLRTQVTLKSAVRGFTALLPADHGYTSYSLINLRGRQIRSGSIANGTTDLRFNNLEKGVLFLRLEGRNNVKAVFRATAL